MSNKRHLTSLDLKAKVVRLGDGWQVSGRSIATLECLLSKWSDSRSALPNDSHTSPPPSLTSGGKSGPPLMMGLNVHKNTPVFTTNLTLSLRVVFISCHLITDKLFPINPRAITGPPKMSLLLEAKSMPALIIKQIDDEQCHTQTHPQLVNAGFTD